MIGILTEKPSAGRNFAKALGGASGTYNGEQFVIVAARGHLYEFAEPEKQVVPALAAQYRSWDLKYLPWNETDFSWKRVKKEDADSALGPIHAQLSKCDEIVIATDVDPTGEGELLAWEILDELGLHPRKWSRMYFTDEAPKSLQKAFVDRKPIKSMMTDMDYIKADYRSKFDFLTIQFTRIASQNGDGKSVLRQGRLKSAMVLIVGDQLKAISEYKKVPFYQNRFRDENGVVYANPEEPQYPMKDQVPNVLHSSSVTVDSKTMKSSAPPKLLDLAALSARLSSRGFKAKDVLAVYQKMYESQVVSYPRTEDKVITPEQFNELLPKIDDIARVVGVNPAVLTHRQPRSSHVKNGGAHGANRPGPNVPSNLADLAKYDSATTKGLAAAIYEMLARNYLATVAEDYEYEAQKGHVTDFPKFVGSANVPKKLGWKEVFDADDIDEDDASSGLGMQAEPFIHEGFPPKPMQPTMKWLMSQLEKHDVGTGATRTSIYADVTNDRAKFPLLHETRGKLSMTEFGDMSYKLLPGTHIGDLKITEQLQADMRDIAAGKIDPAVCLHRMQQMVKDDVLVMAANGVKMRQELGIRLASDVEYVEGKWNGRDVKFKRVWNGHEFSDDEVQCLLDGKELLLFNIEGKNGTKYNVRGKLDEQTWKGRKFITFCPTGYVSDDGTDRDVQKNDEDYYSGTWKRKNVKFKRTWGGHRFTDGECEDLLAGKEISFQATTKGGRDYTAKGKLANQTYNGNKFVGFQLETGRK